MEQLTGTWVPTWVLVVVVSVLTVSLLLGVPLARAAGRRRGYRLAHPEAFASFRDRAKDTALFLAALIPSVLVWLAVMGVSFIGLTGFAAVVMQWQHWTNILVPLSLDGISVSFGAWAFVAVKRGRHPGRAYKIVLAAATMSAVLNFVHGRDRWSIWAGAYLAFLSMAGMAMFHELLDQFMAAYDDEVALKTRYPRFGQRWIYAPVSTFAARRAWIVHPPEEGIRASVRNALEHLQAVRDAKRQRRLDGALRVREEAQAQLVAVEAKAEVRRAKASSGRLFGLAGSHGTGQVTAAPEVSSELVPETASMPAVSPQEPSSVVSVSDALAAAKEQLREVLPAVQGNETVAAEAGVDGDEVALARRIAGGYPPLRMLSQRSAPAEHGDSPANPVAGPVSRSSAFTAAAAARRRKAEPTPQVPPQPASMTAKARVYEYLKDNLKMGDPRLSSPKRLLELALQVPGVSRSSAERYCRMWREDFDRGVVTLDHPPLRAVPREPSEPDEDA